MLYLEHEKPHHIPWNKGKITGQKPPIKLNEVWAIRIRLQIADKKRDLALFNLALDSNLRSCDLVKLRTVKHTLKTFCNLLNSLSHCFSWLIELNVNFFLTYL